MTDITIKTITYSDLIKYVSSVDGQSTLSISKESARVYCSRFKNYVISTSKEIANIVDISVFQSSKCSSKPSLVSVLKTFGRAFIIILSASKTMSKLEIVSLCLSIDILRHSGQNVFACDDPQKTLERIENDHKCREMFEEVFSIPNYVFDFSNRPMIVGKIPADWWPEDFLGEKNSKRRKNVRQYWSIDLFNRDEKKSRLDFENALVFIKQEGHLSEHHKRMRDFRKRNPVTRVKISGRISEEFRDLKSYKTGITDAGDIVRGIWNQVTPTIHEGVITRFLSYICTNWGEDILNGGDGFEEETSIAYMIYHKYIIAYMQNLEEAAGKCNSGSTKVYKTFMAMLKPSTGWIWRREKLIERLPESVKMEIIERGGWFKYCEYSREQVSNFYKNIIKPKLERSVNSQERVREILDSDKPLSYLYNALEECRKEIIRCQDETDDFAYMFQDYILAFLMTCFPLRAKNWSIMTYQPFKPEASNLRLSLNDSWEIRIPVADLKNGRNSQDLKGTSYATFPLGTIDPIKEHIVMLELYIKKFRNKINKTNHLFVNRKGERVSPGGISSMIYRWSEKYISKFSVFSSCVKSVLPFRAHIIRSIVATHYCKMGEISTAAYLLLDSEEVIKKHYLHDNINQKLKRACSNITTESLGIQKNSLTSISSI